MQIHDDDYDGDDDGGNDDKMKMKMMIINIINNIEFEWICCRHNLICTKTI